MPAPRPSQPRLARSPRAALAHLRAADPAMERAIAAVGKFALPEREATLHLLCASVIGQSISVKAAEKIVGRFSERVGDPTRLTPTKLLATSEAELQALGLTRGKACALHGLGELWRRERWTSAKLDRLPDEEIAGKLVAVKGIGPWTAKMFLIFGLRRPDVLPFEDLGLREGLRVIHGLEQRPTPEETKRLAAPWAPWSTVGTVYVWCFLMKLKGETLAGEHGWW
ncbi:MAG: DNA-3-methyladenine glycosylase [Candidatus Sumerlaeota bacterium]|nr:DNA-3-methyladenine glycosylase [Candidatus Sumerlaeota bacterium]